MSIDWSYLRQSAIDWLNEPTVSVGPDGTQDTSALQAMMKDMIAEVDRLRGVVCKLPHTADGVPVMPGMHVWFYSHKVLDPFPDELQVSGWDYLPGMEPGYMFVLNVVNERGEWDGVNLACCYSTREAAEAAKRPG